MALAQNATRDVTFKDLLAGEGLPSKIAPTEIPADFKAVRIKTAGGGGGGIMDMLGGGMFMMMGMLGSMMGGGQGGDEPPMEFLNALEVSWTNGEVLKVQGIDFLVTYKVDFGIAEMASMDKKDTPFKPMLKLMLVQTGSIAQFTPERELTKALYIESLAKVPKPKPATPPDDKGSGGGDGGAAGDDGDGGGGR